MQKTVLISLDGPSLEALIFDAVDKAIKLNQSNTQLPQPVNVAPILSSKQVQQMTGWPNGTFYAKVAEMPEGVVIRKSKRLLFDREKLMVWLKTPARP